MFTNFIIKNKLVSFTISEYLKLYNLKNEDEEY